ncbi:MAG: chromate efflux transporter [Burkholderiaceae bacterium]|nr:chromate efflux transporter [Burkholderiaceae bacterium]
MREVFRAFLALGLSSFGGPIAHLGYFRAEFVERRRWLDERRYAELVALCQFLPGPASSQVGFAIGFERAGWRGALAAWLGFTLPSAVALVLFALGLARVDAANPVLAGVLQALKVVAVAVVAQAVVSMAGTLTPDVPRRLLALLVAAIVLLHGGAAMQVVALAASALVGAWLLRGPLNAAAETNAVAEEKAAARPETPSVEAPAHRVPHRVGAAAAMLFPALIVVLPLAASLSHERWLEVAAAFFRAGALVFGGGHVVLPLLQAGVVAPGWVDESAFVAGYGAAQAVPGPLFTFAAYLGSVIGASGIAGGAGAATVASGSALAAWGAAALCLVAIFVPGILVLIAALPWWEALRAKPALRRAIAGVNAGVVGVLLAAWIDPVTTSAVRGVADALFAAALYALLVGMHWPPWAVVVGAIGIGALRGLAG